VGAWGYLREGYFADAVLLNLEQTYTVQADNLYYRCGWSPFEGHTFPATIQTTFVNGSPVYADGKIQSGNGGMRLRFQRD